MYCQLGDEQQYDIEKSLTRVENFLRNKNIDKSKIKAYINFLHQFYDNEKKIYSFPNNITDDQCSIIDKYDYVNIMIISHLLRVNPVLKMLYKYMENLMKNKSNNDIRKLCNTNKKID